MFCKASREGFIFLKHGSSVHRLPTPCTWADHEELTNQPCSAPLAFKSGAIKSANHKKLLAPTGALYVMTHLNHISIFNQPEATMSRQSLLTEYMIINIHQTNNAKENLIVYNALWIYKNEAQCNNYFYVKEYPGP